MILTLAVCALNARAEDPAGAPANDSAPSVSAVPEINHMVYLSFLPEPAELMADAKRNGLQILRLDRTAEKVVVSYKYPDGHTATLGYALISAAAQADRVAEMNKETPKTIVVTRDPEVIYVDRSYPYRSRVVYRDAYWDDFWLPLTLGVGLGWATSWHGGGHYYGGHHGGHYRGHGGWRH
jgi:hypothetical protein